MLYRGHQYRVEFRFMNSYLSWYSEIFEDPNDVANFVTGVTSAGGTVLSQEITSDGETWEDMATDPNTTLNELRNALAQFHRTHDGIDAAVDVVYWAEKLDESLSSKTAPIPSDWL